MKLRAVIMMAVVVALFGGILYGYTAHVLIKDFKFQPDQISVRSGDTVTWTHPGPASHTVKFADSESQVLSNGASYSRTFGSPGTFDYICAIHPYMKGRVVVQ